MSNHTFLWHDYETFGAVPRRDRPAQFAAIRTDAELNEIGEPIMLFCQPAHDYLPDPVACLITGITPPQALQQGVPEHRFAATVEKAFSEPGTIGVGYNTIRFDDEVTRVLFWRNLIDPYAREWQNVWGNLKTCPENLLLWFHHVPWDHRMKSGRTLWDELCLRYQQGVDEVRAMQRAWDSLRGRIDDERFTHVQQRLTRQEKDACEWRDACVLYFQQFSQRPIPAGVEPAAHSLDYYKSIVRRHMPGHR